MRCIHIQYGTICVNSYTSHTFWVDYRCQLSPLIHLLHTYDMKIDYPTSVGTETSLGMYANRSILDMYTSHDWNVLIVCSAPQKKIIMFKQVVSSSFGGDWEQLRQFNHEMYTYPVWNYLRSFLNKSYFLSWLKVSVNSIDSLVTHIGYENKFPTSVGNPTSVGMYTNHFILDMYASHDWNVLIVRSAPQKKIIMFT